MNKLSILLLMLLSQNLMALDIENFRSGLICSDSDTHAWVCHITEKIYVTGASTCKFNGEKIHCTWTAFEFDYQNITDESEITCKLSSSNSFKPGNPKEQLGSTQTEYTYKLDVPKGNGHFFNPQYTSLSIRSNPPYSDFQKTVCTSEGKVVFEFNYEYIQPKKT